MPKNKLEEVIFTFIMASLHGLRDDCVQYRAEHRRGAGNNLCSGDP